MQYIAELNGWTRFVSMQHQYNLVHREEEREMFGLIEDLGVASLPWSPLAAGLVARPWNMNSSIRGRENPDKDQNGHPLFIDSDKAIIDTVGMIAKERGVSMATISIAWLLNNPLVTSPIVGVTKAKHLDDTVAALDIQLTDEEMIALEEPYTTRLPTYFL